MHCGSTLPCVAFRDALNDRYGLLRTVIARLTPIRADVIVGLVASLDHEPLRSELLSGAFVGKQHTGCVDRVTVEGASTTD